MQPTLAVLLLLLHSTLAAKRVAVFPVREIGDYRTYRDATLLHFRFPEDVESASWNFTIWEKKIYGISACEPRPVNVFVKRGGYPVVSLDSSTFPADYFERNETVYELHFASDKRPSLLNLSTPLAGDWFAVIFSNYTDPDDVAIQQSGLVRVCLGLLESSIDVTFAEDVHVVTTRQQISKKLDAANRVAKFKFYVPHNTSSVTVKVTGLEKTATKVPGSPVVLLETSALITNDKTLGLGCGASDRCEVQFAPSGQTCVYIAVSLEPTSADVVDFSLDVSATPVPTPTPCDASAGGQCWVDVPATRQTGTGFFTFGFQHTPFENGTEVDGFNVSVKVPSLVHFEINPIQDIGGTISIEIGIDMRSVKEYENQFHVLLLACVSHEIRLMPKFPGKCVSSSGLEFPNQLQANSTSESSKTNVKKLHIPFPESGEWYLSLKAFCFTFDTGDKIAEKSCGKLDSINGSLSVESQPCGSDKCGPFGRCTTQMDGGLLFSTCYCLYGYRGWGCTDDSKVAPEYELLIGTLLLTLSNLFLMPAIVVSVRRRFYTEALVYTFTMFFSTFYHACDSGEGTFTFCIFNLSILQFCDFYSAIMSVWVTIIAMANIPTHLCSLAHMAGAVFIALGTEYNRTSLWVFLIPCAVGIFIMSTSWVLRCRRKRSCYPERRYWLYFFPPGMLLILLGLICFSFLQTQRNYKYVHSAWHALMALSILFVLPGSQRPSVSHDIAVDDLEEIRSESQSPTDSTGRSVRTLLNGCLKNKRSKASA